MTKNPGKQRKILHTSSTHVRRRQISASLSPELRKEHRTRSLFVRSGDTVVIMRGEHVGRDGKVTKVDLKKFRILIEGLTRDKADGTSFQVSIHPSKVMIKKLDLDDKRRKEILDRKAATKPVFVRRNNLDVEKKARI